MQTIALEAEKRESLSKGKLNGLRRSGWLPAVLYGGQKKSKKGQGDSISLKVNEKNFLKMLSGGQKSNAIFEIKVGGESANAVIKELQRDVVTRKFIHVDFQRISMAEKIELLVPVRLAGEAPGVKLSGGILEHITREVKISCLPKDIPAEIKVDISQLNIGQGVSVKDIPSVSGVTILSDPHLLVANIVAPTILEEVTPAAAPVAAEPEVIAKGKKPEEGKEGAVPAPAAAAKGAAPAGKTQEKAPAPPAAKTPAGK